MGFLELFNRSFTSISAKLVNLPPNLCKFIREIF
jgi:hypothetical protein